MAKDRVTREREKRRERRSIPEAQLNTSFFALYGSFLSLWGSFDLALEIIVMRLLKISPEDTSIVCGGLAFGGKQSIAKALLKRHGDAVGSGLIKNATDAAGRNHFAHGFMIKVPEAGEFRIIKREVSHAYVAKVKALDFIRMKEHGDRFAAAFQAVLDHFSISGEDMDAYGRTIEGHASERPSPGGLHPEFPTNSTPTNG